MKAGDIYFCSRLGECRVYDVESWHTIVVVTSSGRYFRVSGLSLKGK